LKAILILLLLVSVSKPNKRYNMTTQTNSTQALDVLQQFDALLKNHSIVVTDRENLTKLFQHIVDLCTQMPKTKLKAAIKAATATQEPKTAKPRAKAQPKPKTQPKETMVGPEGAADAPVISDIVAAPVARGRGRPRKADTVAEPVATAAAVADANPNAETAEKKRRGRPKKDKSVTISSNDDEDALIEKMMADVASMQKDEAVIAYPAEAVAATVIADVVIADPITDDDEATNDDETEDEACSPIQTFTGPLMRCEETTPVAESMSPVVPTSSPSSFQTFDFEVEVPSPQAPKEAKAAAPKALKAAKEPKAKAAKEAKVTKEPKAKEAKAPKAAAAKAAAAKKDTKVVAVAPVAKPLASFTATSIHSDSRQENQETNGGIYLMSSVPTTSFSYNGKSYLRTETDNVYDNLTLELIGVWDHSNHEVISAFDDNEDDELYFSDEE
jgi:outer membrane biosynthesis protein TonB